MVPDCDCVSVTDGVPLVVESPLLVLVSEGVCDGVANCVGLPDSDCEVEMD